MGTLYTIIFVHKPTQRTLKTFSGKFMNKFFYEKGKQELLKQLVKSRDIAPEEIDILEHEHADGMSKNTVKSAVL